MKVSEFNASFDPLQPLFNADKRGKMRPRDIRCLLKANTDLVVHVCLSAAPAAFSDVSCDFYRFLR